MNKGLSIYLDAVRFSAALWVLLAHFQVWNFAPDAVARWFPYSGRDAVVLFFVLSGFVIAHSASAKTARAYTIDRLARIYSVAIPVVLLSTGTTVLAVRLDYVDGSSIYQLEKLWFYLPLYFSFLGDAWHLKEIPYGNIPYWSLNFEFWYYALFGVAIYLRGTQRYLALAAILLVVGYKLWVMWPLWLAGVWLYTNRDRWTIGQRLARGLMAATAAAYLALEVTGIDALIWSAGREFVSTTTGLHLDQAQYFLSDYTVAALAVVHLYGARHANLAFPEWLVPAIRWMAGFTFTLYLSHGPLLTFWSIFTGPPQNTVGQALALLLGLLVAVVLIGLVTERQVYVWRSMISRCFAFADLALAILQRLLINLRLLRSHR